MSISINISFTLPVRVLCPFYFGELEENLQFSQSVLVVPWLSLREHPAVASVVLVFRDTFSSINFSLSPSLLLLLSLSVSLSLPPSFLSLFHNIAPNTANYFIWGSVKEIGLLQHWRENWWYCNCWKTICPNCQRPFSHCDSLIKCWFENLTSSYALRLNSTVLSYGLLKFQLNCTFLPSWCLLLLSPVWPLLHLLQSNSCLSLITKLNGGPLMRIISSSESHSTSYFTYSTSNPPGIWLFVHATHLLHYFITLWGVYLSRVYAFFMSGFL